MIDSAFSHFHPKFVISLYCFQESLQKVTSNTGRIRVISKLSLVQAVIHKDILRLTNINQHDQHSKASNYQMPVEPYLHVLQDEAT